MKTLKLDKNNNLIISQKNINVIDGIDACSQDCINRLGLIQGENPYNIDEGIDYFGEILGIIGNNEYYKDVFTNRIKENEEITEVNNIEISKDNNELKVEISINSIYGNITI
jgi:hypothetical protein